MLFDSFIETHFSIPISDWTGEDVYTACSNPDCGREKKMGIHRDKGIFHCFVCGHSGGAVQLIQETLGVTTQRATEQLKVIYQGQTVSVPIGGEADLLEEMVNRMGTVREPNHNPTVKLPRGCIPIAGTRGATYLCKRGFKYVDYKQYGLLLCTHPKEENELRLRNYIIFPDYCPSTGKLRYWTSRYAGFRLPERTKKSYNPKGIPRRGVLYGLFAVPASRNTIILVEGPLDVLALPGQAIALLSNQITDDQATEIAIRFRKVIICLDGDAKTYALDVANRLRRKGMEHIFVSFLSYNDPAEALAEKGEVVEMVREEAQPFSPSMELGVKLGMG